MNPLPWLSPRVPETSIRTTLRSLVAIISDKSVCAKRAEGTLNAMPNAQKQKTTRAKAVRTMLISLASSKWNRESIHSLLGGIFGEEVPKVNRWSAEFPFKSGGATRYALNWGFDASIAGIDSDLTVMRRILPLRPHDECFGRMLSTSQKSGRIRNSRIVRSLRRGRLQGESAQADRSVWVLQACRWMACCSRACRPGQAMPAVRA